MIHQAQAQIHAAKAVVTLDESFGYGIWGGGAWDGMIGGPRGASIRRWPRASAHMAVTHTADAYRRRHGPVAPVKARTAASALAVRHRGIAAAFGLELSVPVDAQAFNAVVKARFALRLGLTVRADVYSYTDITPHRIMLAGARLALKAQPEARALRPGGELRGGRAYAEARTQRTRSEDRRAGEHE